MSLLNDKNTQLKKDIIELLGAIPEIKGGKKSQRGGGYCEIHGSYPGTRECPSCYIKRINDESEKRRDDKEKKTRRTIRKNRRSKTPSRFQRLRIENPVGAVEKEYNAHLDELSAGNFSPITGTNVFRNIIALGKKLESDKNKRWWWRISQLRYAILEAIFFTLGGYLTYETYWHTIYLAEYLMFFVEASIPSEMKKQMRKEDERAKADMERSLRRRLREGFQARASINNENPITPGQAESIGNALDNYAEDETPILRLPSPEGAPPSPQPKGRNWIFGQINDAMRTAMGRLGTTVTTTIDNVEELGVGTYRYIQDKKDEIGKPITTGGDVIHELTRGFNAIAPLLFAFLFIIYYLKKGRKVWTDDVNKWPEEPDFPDDQKRDPKGDGSGSGQGGHDFLLGEGGIETHGGRRRRRRKKTRKKRRKTRRKSKRRKKRKRKTKRRRKRRR